jgi:hypothetical protein
MSELASAVAGDKVFRGWGDMLRVETIESVTKLHIILKCGGKYRVRSGCEVGSTAWNRDYIRPYVESEWMEYRQAAADTQICRALCEYKWMSLDIETARAIHTMLPKATK